MEYIIFISLASIVLLLITVIVCLKLYKKTKTKYEEENLQLAQLQEEYSKLAEAYKIKKENKEKADAEISDLHNGTTTADDILPKRKSRA